MTRGERNSVSRLNGLLMNILEHRQIFARFCVNEADCGRGAAPPHRPAAGRAPLIYSLIATQCTRVNEAPALRDSNGEAVSPVQHHSAAMTSAFTPFLHRQAHTIR